MDVTKDLIKQIIDQEYEKIILAELFSKRSANLEEIVDQDLNPSTDDVLKSDHFQKSLFSDLIDGMKNFANWKVVEKSGSLDSVEHYDDDSFPINYDFQFTYNYKGASFPLSLMITGYIDISWNGRYRSATYLDPPEYPEASIDTKRMGDKIKVNLYTEDGSEIALQRTDGKPWMTDQIKRNIANAVLSPYL
jgi:hypothetical protein